MSSTTAQGSFVQERPLIALDGTESTEGRALFVISALYWCLDWLPAVDLRIIDVKNEDVSAAVQVLRWEHGVDLQVVDVPESESPLLHADLYAAAAFRSADHLRVAEAEEAGIPLLLTLQYPDEAWLSFPVLCRRDAAFNPRVFARELEAAVKPWL